MYANSRIAGHENIKKTVCETAGIISMSHYITVLRFIIPEEGKAGFNGPILII
jgi:hypothetical protein